MTLSSCSWYLAWIGLEINMLGFIPYIISNFSSKSSVIKYFIVQARRSLVLIFFFMFLTLLRGFHIIFFSLFLTIAMLYKLGAAPVHVWFVDLSYEVNLSVLIWLLSWQKLSVLYIIYLFYDLYIYILIFGVIRLIFGSVGMVYSNMLFTLLVYSSISHIGWLLSLLWVNMILYVSYLRFYLLTIVLLLIFILKENYLFNVNLWLVKNKGLSSLFLLVLIGLPPTSGFIIKLMALWFLIYSGVLVFLFLFRSLISLWAYVKLCYRMGTFIYQYSLSNTESCIVISIQWSSLLWMIYC